MGFSSIEQNGIHQLLLSCIYCWEWGDQLSVLGGIPRKNDMIKSEEPTFKMGFPPQPHP